MSPAEMQKRLEALERTVRKLESQMAQSGNGQRRWWVEDAGRFADDPLFDEIVRLGQEYRESLRPAKRNLEK
jgi:hypothetical protein